ncbi:MAG: hypothetical protein E7477_06085, partial [Ruminococcaceae bacterium]|nr:hypothetical protein [Oscillospiraceae bacterium]
MKHLFTDLWASIRKSPFLFLFLFIQIVITSLVLYIVLSNYYWIDERSNSAQIAWGDKEYFKLFTKSNAPIDKIMLLTFSSISDETAETYQEEFNLFNQVDEFYNQAKKIDDLIIMPNNVENPIILNNTKEWKEEDKKTGGHMMFDLNDNGSFSKLNTY